VHQCAQSKRESLVTRSAAPVVRVPTYGQALYAPVSPGFGRRLAREIRRRQPDLLHVHMPNTSAFWLLMPGMPRCPMVIHWHSDIVGDGMDARLRLLYPAYRPFEQALLKRASAIIATSPGYLESSLALQAYRERCAVIPLGLDRQRLALAREEAPSAPRWLDRDALKLLATGRLSRYKGFDQLIRAVRQTPGVELLIAGDGEERAKLQALLGDAQSQARIRLLGRVSDAERNRLMSQCDLFCLPSLNRAEAFGLVLLEAMAFGKPALVTTVAGSGMSWVVRDGETGWHVEPDNPQAMAARLAHIRDHRDEIERYGAAAGQRFRDTFAIDPVAQRTLELYRHVLAAS
jgi:rhamnosyl/mannosyltransferase